MLFLGDFILKPIERASVLLKNGTWDFQNSNLFKISRCLYETASGDFERFQYFNFETNILEYQLLVENT